MAVDAKAFRDTIALFATGVAIVIAEVEGQVHAMTANAITSLSLDPLLVLFCPGKRARLAQSVAQMQRFTINFLREDQQALSTFFAGAWKEPHPPPYRFVEDHGVPRLEGALGAVICEKSAVHDGGDHLLVIGRVVALHQGLEPHHPLLFFKGQYRKVERGEGREAPSLSDVTDEPPTVFYH